MPFTVTVMSWLSVLMPRPLVRRRQRACGQHAGEMALKFLAGMDAAARIDGALHQRGRFRDFRQRRSVRRPARRLPPRAKTGPSPALQRPMRASAHLPSPSRRTVQATPMMAKSPRRRDISIKHAPERGGATGSSISGQHLVRLERRGQRADKKIPRLDPSFAASPTARATGRRASTRSPAFPRPDRHAKDCRRWFRDCGFADAR